MIPLNYSYAPKGNCTFYKRVAQQSNITADNVQSIEHKGLYNIKPIANMNRPQVHKVTLDAMVADKWEVGMEVKLAGTQITGSFIIVDLNVTDKTLDILVPGEMITQAAPAGTATPWGVIQKEARLEDAQILYNNAREVVGYKYSTASTFIMQRNAGEVENSYIQIKNLDTGVIDVLFYMSINGIDYVPMAISGSIDANGSEIYEIPNKGRYTFIKFTVSPSSSSFYVVGV